jgi:uncharacterized membrane protein
MTYSNRLQVWPLLILPLLAGGVLALAWWDWTYQGQVLAWWHGERVYAFHQRQLMWMLLVAEGACLGLWLLSASVDADSSKGLFRASLPFLLAFLVLPFFARYTFHPLGIQPGSSVWTYELVVVTVAVLAFPLSKVVHVSAWNQGRRRRGLIIVCALAALYALVFGFLSTARHASFRTHALDMGTMDQAAWNTVHGRILERTPLYRFPSEGSRYENRLLDAKLELIFVPLSALYWLWADPRILLIVQTLSLAAGAIPLYLLIYDQARDALSATLLAAAYLFYLPLHYVNMAEFHPSALMVPLLIAGWRAMRQGRWRGYYLWLILALSCRIDAAFVALPLGIAIASWQKGRRRHGAYTALLALAWLAIDFAVVVPAVQQVYGPGAGDLVARRFGVLGDGPVEMLQTILTRPAFVAAQFADREKLQTLFDLFVPSGFVSLLHPLALAPALPILAINMLAASTWQNSVHAHYMAPVIPFIWIAAGEGLAWLSRQRTGSSSWRLRSLGAGFSGLLGARRRPPRQAENVAPPSRETWAPTFLAVFAMLNTALLSLLFSPFPPGKAFHLADFYQPSAYQENLSAVIAQIPDGASVCAQSDIHPHISQRRDACLFYRCTLEGAQGAEYVVVDLDAASTKSPLGFHAFYELVDLWLRQDDFGVVAQSGGVLLFRRGAPRGNIADVRAALDAYGKDLYRVDFVDAQVPARLKARELYRIPITLANTGSQCWSARDWLPVRLSYRWWADNGALLMTESLRTDVPHRVEPENEVKLRAWLLTPPRPGQYTLEWDVLREGDAWFSDKGGMVLRQKVTIE